MIGTYQEKPPLLFITDAVALLEMAEALPAHSSSHHASLCRSAVLSSALAIEASANCLLSLVELPERLADHLDQARPMEKFEFFFQGVDPGGSIDRGSSVVQPVQELLRTRNLIAHPRPQERGVKVRDLGSGSFSVQKTEEPKGLLRLPPSPEDWRFEHGKRCLSAVLEFLDWFMIDLCKMENHQIRAALVSEVRFGSSVAVLVPAPQRQALLTTLPRWELSSRASLEILGDLGGETATGIPFTARYSWQEGGAQLHNQEMELRTHGQARLVDAATQALQTFLVWFNQEHRLPHGRSLLSLELCSQDGSVRHSDYRSFIPIGADPVEEGPYRPVGLAKGVSKSLFANGLVGTETRKNHAVATLSLDDGKGRELSIPIQVVATLTHMITLNARSDWVEYPLVIAPDQVDTKGNDYVIDQFDVIAYDPISRTAFVTYKAASGTVVQVNLPPGVLLALRRSLEET